MSSVAQLRERCRSRSQVSQVHHLRGRDREKSELDLHSTLPKREERDSILLSAHYPDRRKTREISQARATKGQSTAPAVTSCSNSEGASPISNEESAIVLLARRFELGSHDS